MNGIIFDVKEMAVHDGDGVRLTVFMKGCPLHCEWCHNPEGLKPFPELTYKKKKCIKCGRCFVRCEHEECKPFGRCIKVCPVNALEVCGRSFTPQGLADVINGHKRILKLTGGGVTFSGGEPLMQWEFIKEVVALTPDMNTAAETCGYVDKRTFSEAISVLDEIIMDIKLFDESEHIKYTGVSNKIIKENFLLLKNSGKPFVIRTPLIEGKTDTKDNLENIKNFIGNSQWELLPENKLAKAKYEMLTGI